MNRRILVTGSREWDDPELIRRVLAVEFDANPRTVLVVGGNPRGADRIAENYWRYRGGQVELHKADWKRHTRDCPDWHYKQQVCKLAGLRRNAYMVTLGADRCIAFIRNQSPGATHCADLAAKRGIPTRRYLA
jgi:hypothetical protein